MYIHCLTQNLKSKLYDKIICLKCMQHFLIFYPNICLCINLLIMLLSYLQIFFLNFSKKQHCSSYYPTLSFFNVLILYYQFSVFTIKEHLIVRYSLFLLFVQWIADLRLVPANSCIFLMITTIAGNLNLQFFNISVFEFMYLPSSLMV